jgi:hypothetical protein
MNEQDYLKMFGITDSPELRMELQQKEEALQVQLRDDLLMAKVNYKDRVYVAGVIQMPFVTRNCNYNLNVSMGVVPYCFTRN